MQKVVKCLLSIIAVLAVFLCFPAKAQASDYNAGYYETSTTLTKHVGQTFTPTTDIDGVAKWTSSDSSVAIVNSYSNSGASISFIKEGVATVTFTNTYTYVKPVFEQTGTTTGVWHSETCTGETVVYFVITVKEAIGTSLFAGGNGSSQFPYLISTKEQLANMNNTEVLGSYFTLTNDIAFSPEDFKAGGEFFNDGNGWFPIGYYAAGVYGKPFSGVFDGNGYVISGLQCYYSGTGNLGQGYFGLFGVNSYGTIKNLGVENSVFLCYSASDDKNQFEYVGGIAGDNFGFIYNCYVSNCIIGGNSAGGITGYQQHFLSNCYSAHNSFVVGGAYLDHQKGFLWGGLAGSVYLTLSETPNIYSCYTADLDFVGWQNTSGAIAGYLLNNTTIEDCYYNNTDVGAFYHRAGTTATKLLTTDAMQRQSSFSGLNFTNIWTIDNTAAYKYPTLKVFHPFQEALYVSALPKKTVYLVGSNLDLAGGEVSFTNSDGNTYSYSMTDSIFNPTADTPVTSIKGSISDVDMSSIGEKSITIEYMGQTAEFKIYVVDSKLDSTLKITCPSISFGGILNPKVEQNDSQANVTYLYYSDSSCAHTIAKPSAVGTYYIKAFTPETDVYKASSSDVVEFSIKPNDCTVSVAANSTSWGSVSGGGTFNCSTSVTIKAIPMAGYRFVRWLEGATAISTAAEYQFTVTKSRALTAEFARISTPAVKAVSASYNSIKITWGAVIGTTKYEVYRAASSTGVYAKITETTSTDYSNSGLTAGMAYYFKVRVKCVAGSTVTYGSFSAVVPATPVPTTPTGVKATSVSNTSIKITWGAVIGIMKYEVCRATSSNGTYTKLTETASTNYSNSGLTTGKAYYYKIRAYRSVMGKKVYSNNSALVSAKPVPATPTGLKAARLSSTSIKLTWGFVSGATKYEVYRATSSTGTYTKLTETALVCYNNSGLTTGHTYYYKVCAYQLVAKTKVYGGYSSIVSIKP